MAEAHAVPSMAPALNPRRTKDLEARIVDLPRPEPKKVGEIRDAMNKLLQGMEVGKGAIEVNRARRSVENYIRAFRREFGMSWRFTLRGSGVSTTRIWRRN